MSNNQTPETLLDNPDAFSDPNRMQNSPTYSASDEIVELHKRHLENEEYKQKIKHNDDDQEMKKKWSKLLSIYLIIFTTLMFGTLWLNGSFFFKCLPETTMNFLITVGFVKVVGVVYVIVAHLFPKNEKK